jgi:GTP pyrophosphokinase
MDFTLQEQKYVLSSFENLISSCPRCHDDEKIKLLRKAFEFAHKAHYPTRRKSGEPYILHPIYVAQICCTELNLGTTSMVAALLHDVVEDTEVTVEEIKNEFGEEISIMVDGLTKISGAISVTNSMQSENFKKILITMSQDIRVMLIKLADRLHNIRTLDSMPRHKQLRIASETFYIFAPIAHRIGLYTIKTELEDNAFRIKQPKECAEIERKLKNTDAQRTMFINKFSLPIAAHLTEKKYDFDISGRPKSLYGIYQKMIKKGIPFEEIYDLFAIRIIFTPKEDEGSEKEQCFKIYSIVTDIYTPRPDRLRDWVTTPKENGYESLHSTVMGPNGQWVEVQIRTRRMDEIAEFGYAAHFKYKGNQSNEGGLDNLYDIMREAIVTADPDTDEFMDNIKSILTTSKITIFTPKGDMHSFPQGATALDFAYAIHEDIGNRAISAKVNHRNMPLSYELKNGDQIEIITSQKQKPSFDWLNIVQTAKARYSLRKAINQEVDKKANVGQKKLNNLLTELNLTVTPRIIEKVKLHYDIEQDKEDRFVFAYLSEQELNLDILRKILRQSSPEKKILFWTIKSKENTTKEADKPTTNNIKYNYTLADCCRPIPGDPVMGFKMHQNIIEIHHVSCPEAVRLSSQQGNKIVEVDWFSREQKAFLSDLRISGVDRIGLVSDITTVLSKELDVNIRSINIYTHDGIFDGSFELYVRSIEDLNDIMSKLRKIQGVDNVLRPM